MATSTGHNNIIQSQDFLNEAVTLLGRANNEVATAIAVGTDPGGDGAWSTLATVITTAIGTITTAMSAVNFYPENIQIQGA